jgi:metallo-beta-lactamase class B
MFGRLVVAGLSAAALALPAAAQPPSPAPSLAAACGERDGWSDLAPPARLYGNTWYVGTCGITALLVKTSAGLVLRDGGVPEAAALVLANIRKLGFSPRKVRWILVSHEHYDHAGALGAIQRATRAGVIAGPFQRRPLASGRPDPDDPQAPLLGSHPMKPLRIAKVLASGAQLKVGGTSFTATATPAHSPGSTSWTWRACEAARCPTIAYADSASTISADDYRFADHPARIAAVRSGHAAIAALPCDIIVTPHPDASDLFARMSGAEPLIQSGACRTYAQAAMKRFADRLAAEQQAVTGPK